MAARPDTIHGGCLCEAIRYEVKVPDDHDFYCSTCQCTQCRKQTGSLIFRIQVFPLSSVTFTPPLTASTASPLKSYSATPGVARGFCGDCGSFIYWRRESGDNIDLLVGTFDEDDLRKYGETLTTASVHLYCEREIKGVTDHLEGVKYKLDNEGEGVELMPNSKKPQ
ncbi:glutathione-dependent formaldehyde-activating enzyme domain-containing protein [Sarocladium implicatum]|nr:glutathione-dependent formaldehyde-activating enzyme domain-containing protein [Sarocladium implicatum]